MRIHPYFFGISLLSSSAFAGIMGPISFNAFDGLYLGASIGAAALLDKESTPYAPNAYDRHQLSATGFVGGGILGYDFSLTNCIKMGIEAFGNYTELSAAADQRYGSNPSFNARMHYNAGVRVLPGFELSPGTVGHIILGYSYGQFTFKDNGDFGYIDRSLANNGFQFGVGIVVPFCLDNLSLRTDMVYTTYKSNTSLGLSPTFTPQNYYDNFATLEATLALIYKF